MKLSIIVPVYNEEKTVRQVLQKLASLNLGEWEKEIIIVDDGSLDNSKIKIQNAKLELKNQNLIFIQHEKNQGKGAAIKTGLEEVSGNAVIIQDADLEYDPLEIKNLLDRFDGKRVVFGSRNLKPYKRGYSHYVLGAKIITSLVNFFYRAHLTDVYTCYKLFPKIILNKLNLKSEGFEFEMEVTVKLMKNKVEIIEVPIKYNPRKFEEGKKIRAKDAFIGVWVLIKNLV